MGPVLGFLGSVFFGVGLAGASAAYVIAVNVARFAILSLASQALAPKIDLQRTANDKLFTTKNTVQPQAFVYGQDMLSGPLLYANVANDEDLYRVVALTGREIDSFVSFRIDDDDIVIGSEIPDDSDTVTGGRFANVVDIDTRLGTASQTTLSAFNTAFPSLWTSAHRARGWSLLGTVMRFEGNSVAFESGIPQNVRAVVNGHKVYDPRLDSTQTTIPGSGSHRVNDESTWEWSDNPALCLADWLMWEDVGYGEESDRIDWDKVATAGDICEESVSIPGSTTQNRYTCNFTFFADQQRGSVKNILEDAMLGRCIFSQGKWRMWAGAAQTATVSLSEANLRGGIQLQASTSIRNRVNRIRGKYIDPDRDYQAVAYPAQTDATYLSEDNNEVHWQTRDFNACNNTYEAQRNAIIELRRARNEKKLRFEGNWSCFRVQPGTVVQITNTELGWTDKKFFITEWILDKEALGVTIVGVEENDSDWADPDVGDYTTRTATGELVSSQSSGVKLTSATISNEGDGTVEAGVVLKSNGELRYLSASGEESAAGVPASEWATKLGTYYIRCTEDVGSIDTGTVGTWQDNSADREYSIQNSTAGAETATITVEVATDEAGTNIVATAEFVLSAYVNEFYVIDDEDTSWVASAGDDHGIHWQVSDGRLYMRQGGALTPWNSTPQMFRSDIPTPGSTSYIRLSLVSTEGDGAFVTTVYASNAYLWLDDGSWHAVDGLINLLWLISSAGTGGFTVDIEYSDDQSTVRASHRIRYVWTAT